MFLDIGTHTTISENRLKYIQAPLLLILLEVLTICVIRSILAYMGIVKYRHKRDECYKAPILDSSYFAGGPTYLEVSIQLKPFHSVGLRNENRW
ncbi:unnamed protein product [Toxocara canis]|uniref:Transmembrane protein n=1 Tax=Toxocara canis TaxID=6265 RepID=A0A183VE31_TOXCA|nr:unnamed protein product [Toxocara canis]